MTIQNPAPKKLITELRGVAGFMKNIGAPSTAEMLFDAAQRLQDASLLIEILSSIPIVENFDDDQGVRCEISAGELRAARKWMEQK
ncbi:MAG: hypothetical protein WC714_28805 [Candidatus Obscuribacterales bacterium]|jgi:hypothetical protein